MRGTSSAFRALFQNHDGAEEQHRRIACSIEPDFTPVTEKPTNSDEFAPIYYCSHGDEIRPDYSGRPLGNQGGPSRIGRIDGRDQLTFIESSQINGIDLAGHPSAGIRGRLPEK